MHMIQIDGKTYKIIIVRSLGAAIINGKTAPIMRDDNGDYIQVGYRAIYLAD